VGGSLDSPSQGRGNLASIVAKTDFSYPEDRSSVKMGGGREVIGLVKNRRGDALAQIKVGDRGEVGSHLEVPTMKVKKRCLISRKGIPLEKQLRESQGGGGSHEKREGRETRLRLPSLLCLRREVRFKGSVHFRGEKREDGREKEKASGAIT